MIKAKHKILIASLCVFLFNSCAKEEVKVAEEFSSPERTYRFWMETAEKGDIPNNMRSITEASKRIMDSQLRDMDTFMRRLNENTKVFKTYTIMEQKSKDDKAVVVLKGQKGDLMVVPLKKEADGWKIDLLSLFGG